MSRIAGIIYPSAFQVTETIKEMQSIYPSQDDFAYYRHKNLEIGAWNTPIATNKAKTIWATLEGKIHNADELRRDLKKQLGINFLTNTDSELIVFAYDAWKEGFISKLNGPFVLAVFDEVKRTLLLARDRMGQKSLYWTNQGDFWLFSSEIKGLLSTGIVPQNISNEAFASYLHFGFIPQDYSPINGVNKLLPCHYVKVDLDRRAVFDQYWSFSRLIKEKKHLKTEETYERFGKCMEDAVRISLPEEGEIGSFLTGDLGSSAMNWFLSHSTTRDRIRAYTSVFDEPHPVELNLSSEIAKTLFLTHEIKRIKPDEVIEELPKIVWHLDEPLADPFVVQTWNLGKIASSECSLAYTNIGWEEMLGGSSRYFTSDGRQKRSKLSTAFVLSQLPPSFRERVVLPLLKLFGSNYLFRILRNVEINRDQVIYLMNSALFKEHARKKASPLLYKYFDPEVFAQRFHRLSTIPGNIDPSLYYDAKTQLPDRLLIQYDRLLTPYNIRVINPFLDTRLVEFLATVPEETKFEAKQPGAILHQLMMRLCHACPPFPERTDSFMETWRTNSQFRHLFGLLAEGRLVDEGFISGRWIRQQLGYPYLTAEMFHQLWAIMILEVWFRLYIDRPIDLAHSKLSLEEILKE